MCKRIVKTKILKTQTKRYFATYVAFSGSIEIEIFQKVT